MNVSGGNVCQTALGDTKMNVSGLCCAFFKKKKTDMKLDYCLCGFCACLRSIMRRILGACRAKCCASANVLPLTLLVNDRGFEVTPTLLMKRFRGRGGRGRGRGRGGREAQEGDWLCGCGETNYRSKRECFKCGAPAPPLPPGVRRPSLPGEDPNDWACPCGQMNFRGSVVCYKCKQQKPVTPAAPGQEITMWKCGKCSNINRSNRKFCFKCFSPSPVAGEGVGPVYFLLAIFPKFVSCDVSA
ncbi:zinc finger protein, putative [Bodo saltans]|uniref:Zinc finger protein, putative n=1 Tax=Bodo saltans TaxID=75058 RepID=A0A0S4KKT8_BODSA|nr:zinc finger protein, putative [Bodo saltans]|eukprot:CUI15009.1 zinc finger protein, putative [Bodo saltans]